jgi:multidrug efflux pump subunit AcrA (membrane-fusion protein)
MPHRRPTVPVRAVVLGALLLGIAACGGREEGGEHAAAPEGGAVRSDSDTSAGVVTLSARARAFSGLQLAVASARIVSRTVQTTGSLAWDPASVSALDAPVRGRVLALHGNVGDRVAAGSVVAVIENPDNLDGRFTVRAVRGGVVTDRSASVGAVVDAGSPLLRLVDDAHLWLLVDVPPAAGDRPRPGGAVDADIPAAGIRVHGTVAGILPRADSVSHVALARVTVPNPRRVLVAGMRALVTAQVGAPVRAAVIPRAALVFVQGRTAVFVPDGAGYRPVPVEPGAPLPGDSVAILRGLAPGERVVTVGAQQLANAHYNFRGLGDDEDDEGHP